jgi:hypothetical protein
LISSNRDVNTLEGRLEDGEILIFHNGVTNEIFNVYKFIFGNDESINGFSDTKLIAHTLGKLGIFNIDDVASRIGSLDSGSRFVIISNNKYVLLGNFNQMNKDVLLSSGVYSWLGRCGYNYYAGGYNGIRLNISSSLEKEISKLTGIAYQKIFFYMDNLNFGMFVLELGNRKLYLGLRGLKRYLRKIKMDENKIKEFVEKIRKELNELVNRYEY